MLSIGGEGGDATVHCVLEKTATVFLRKRNSQQLPNFHKIFTHLSNGQPIPDVNMICPFVLITSSDDNRKRAVATI